MESELLEGGALLFREAGLMSDWRAACVSALHGICFIYGNWSLLVREWAGNFSIRSKWCDSFLFLCVFLVFRSVQILGVVPLAGLKWVGGDILLCERKLSIWCWPAQIFLHYKTCSCMWFAEPCVLCCINPLFLSELK